MIDNIEKVKEEIEKHELEFVRLLYIDLDNVIRGRVATAEDFESTVKSGLTLAAVMQSGFSLLEHLTPESRFGPVGESRLMPDLDTFRRVPWTDKAAQVICDQFTEEFEPFKVDPRPILKEYLEELDYNPLIGVEPEFYLFKEKNGEIVPYDKHLCFATSGMNKVHRFMVKLKDTLKRMGVEMKRYYPEYGQNQHEVPLGPASPVEAADNLIVFREAVRGLGERNGINPTFMPKPSEDLPGSGLHLHVSLWQDNKNIFYSERDEYHLSDEGYYFAGGILRHLEALLGITAASVNSYKRLIPHNWASAYKCWGPKNREAAIRLPLPLHEMAKQTTRFELKFIDATAHPHFAIGSILAAGIDGIEKEIDPSEVSEVDPGSLTEEERAAKGWERYPENLLDAIRALNKSEFFREVWGDTLIEEYVQLKKFQWDHYHLRVTDWEKDAYRETF